MMIKAGGAGAQLVPKIEPGANSKSAFQQKLNDCRQSIGLDKFNPLKERLEQIVQNKGSVDCDLKFDYTIPEVNLAVSALAEALKVNTTITHLSLTFNVLGEKGAKDLAIALNTNTTLDRLTTIFKTEDASIAMLEGFDPNSTSFTHCKFIFKTELTERLADALKTFIRANTREIELELEFPPNKTLEADLMKAIEDKGVIKGTVNGSRNWLQNLDSDKETGAG